MLKHILFLLILSLPGAAAVASDVVEQAIRSETAEQAVALATDEVLGVGCKTAILPAVLGPTCTFVPCSVNGS